MGPSFTELALSLRQGAEHAEQASSYMAAQLVGQHAFDREIGRIKERAAHMRIASEILLGQAPHEALARSIGGLHELPMFTADILQADIDDLVVVRGRLVNIFPDLIEVRFAAPQLTSRAWVGKPDWLGVGRTQPARAHPADRIMMEADLVASGSA